MNYEQLVFEQRNSDMTKEEAAKLIAYIMLNHDVMLTDLGMPKWELAAALKAKQD